MINVIVISRMEQEKKCDLRQPNLISKQKPTFKEKPKHPEKQFLRGKSQCNLMNKSKESKMFGIRTQIIMDD